MLKHLPPAARQDLVCVLLCESLFLALSCNKRLFHDLHLLMFQGLIIDDPVLPFKSKIWLIDDVDETT